MKNPYADLPPHAFWRRSVSQVLADDVDPVLEAPFGILADDRVATAGSCFAQHISRMLVSEGFCYLVTEREPRASHTQDGTPGAFSARFGNIYTVRQLLQLFDRAYGLFSPVDSVWQRPDGAWVDPFRPRIEEDGFATIDVLLANRTQHLFAVREMFEQCDIFIFTLGLTEGWLAETDGAVFPLAPGVVGSSENAYQFENFSVDGMIQDLLLFIDKVRTINPKVRIILTVSPVPLIATYEDRHVLVSNTYSKAALRVVAEVASRNRPEVAYFPSFEIITGSYQRARFYADDLREVTAEGVAHVMSLFKRHYLGAIKPVLTEAELPKKRHVDPLHPSRLARVEERSQSEDAHARLRSLNKVICEEELLDPIPHRHDAP